MVNTPGCLSLPPSLFLSSPTPTHIAATRLSFRVHREIHRRSSTNTQTEAAFYFISHLFPLLSELRIEHVCEVLFHPRVPLKPVQLASLSIKPVHFASPHVCASKRCNRCWHFSSSMSSFTLFPKRSPGAFISPSMGGGLKPWAQQKRQLAHNPGLP